MNTDQFLRQAMTFAKQKDMAGFAALAADMDSDYIREELAGELLSKDHVEFCKIVYDDEQIFDWCEDNARHVCNKCPDLFDYWSHCGRRMGDSVLATMDELSETQRVVLLTTGGTTPPQRLVAQMIRQDPDNWLTMSPAWIGADNSPLREAAAAMGWTPLHVPSMLQTTWTMGEEPAWLAHFEYPYSIVTAQMLREDIAMTWTVVCPVSANPVDVALANILFANLQHQDVSKPAPDWLIKHPDVPEMSPEALQTLQTIVQAHIGLGALDELLESLVHNTLPGWNAPACDIFELPEFGRNA